MTNRERADLHIEWWERRNTEPLVHTFAPVDTPYGGLDIDVPPEDIADRKLANIRAAERVPSDKLQVAGVDFSTAFVPALAGAGFEYDETTSWALPIADTVAGLTIPAFDPEHPLFAAYEEREDRLLDAWSWDTFLPALADYLGPADVVAALVGTQNLALDMYEHPSDMQRVLNEAAEFHRQMLAYQLKKHRAAGLTEGVTDVFQQWLPGDGVRFSEDVTAIMGERHYRDFFRAADRQWLAGLDSTFIHTHSAALPCLPALLDMPELGAIEISNDPNGPDLDTIIAAGRQVQAAGKPLQISNWEHPLTEDDIRHLLAELDVRGLCVTLQPESLDHAKELYELAKNSGAPAQ